MKQIPNDQLELPLGMPKPHYCAECGRRIKRYGLGSGCKAEIEKRPINQILRDYVERESEYDG